MSGERPSGWLLIPPPLLFVAPLLVSQVFERLWPLVAAPPAWQQSLRWIGIALIAVGAVHAASAIALFVKSRTTIVPHHRSSALVTSGAYRWTRNPMYVSLTFLYLGVAILLTSIWALPFLALPLYVMNAHVIPMEERQLDAVFGETYARYKSRVRRWL
jgi:protein-S-isoprenylcysteine O-methyltransferase Ste14